MFATRSVTVLAVLAFTLLMKASSTTTGPSSNSTTESSPSSQTSTPTTSATSNSTSDSSTSTSPNMTTSTTISISTTTETQNSETYPDNDTATTNGNADNVASSKITSVSSNASNGTQTSTPHLPTSVKPASSGKNTNAVTNSTDTTSKPHSTVLPAGSTHATETISVTTRTGSTKSQDQTSESQVTLQPPKKTTTKYATYSQVNGSCPRGYIIRTNICVYLCEDKVCQNGGVCAVVSDNAGSDPVALCRCKIDSETEYSGDNCETSKISRLKERKITLGVLIPVVCILLPVLMCTCLKLKRHGNSARAMRDKYDINSGAL